MAQGRNRWFPGSRAAALLVAGTALSIVSSALMADSGRTGKSAGRRSAPLAPAGQTQIPTTLADFFQPGTQPDPTGAELAPIVASTSCSFCHGEYLEDPSYEEPWDGWVATVMAQSARDPVWHAALAIANQDSNMSGEYCIRCHSPGAWLRGHSVPPDGSAFEVNGNLDDFDGVTCHFCHRAVSPVLLPDSPAQDGPILAALDFPPGDGRGNGRYVVDPADVRRGPYQDIAENPAMNLHGVPVIHSPFHRSSEICATCHDVMNPVFMKQPDGSYLPTALDEPHPTQDPHDMFPEQPTYSEWAASQFAQGGVLFEDGRFGGEHPTGVMESCQDCHMPKVLAGGCFAWEFPPFFARPDLPRHFFLGANTWVLRAVRAIYYDSETGLSQQSVDDAIARNIEFLRAASDTEAVQVGDDLRVRVINWAGHKLPTGYPEGRRMWLNVRFYDADDQLIDERGAYDLAQAQLDASETKVYKAIHVLDEAVAALSGLPADTENHLALNNKIEFDNRIPPMGFTNAAYAEFGSAPVGQTYADGQHWDDTTFGIPSGAVRAVVTLYYQPMTREYAEFLRDTNVTNDAGQTVFDLWADPAVGNKVPPVDMDMVEIELVSGPAGDLNGDGAVTFDDLLVLLSAWGPCPPPSICGADLDGSGDVGFSDLLLLLSSWS